MALLFSYGLLFSINVVYGFTMPTANTDITLTANQIEDSWTKTTSAKPMSQIRSVRNLMLVFALFLEMSEFQHQHFANQCAKSLSILLRGYEYHWKHDCVVQRSLFTGKVLLCRKRRDCGYCQEADEIDEYDSSFMSPELLMERYAKTGRPVVIRNAVRDWLAMKEFSFNFFKDLYTSFNR